MFEISSIRNNGRLLYFDVLLNARKPFSTFLETDSKARNFQFIEHKVIIEIAIFPQR